MDAHYERPLRALTASAHCERPLPRAHCQHHYCDHGSVLKWAPDYEPHYEELV